MSAGPATDQLQTFFELSDTILDPGAALDERLREALRVGTERLEFSAGFLTNVDPAAGRQEMLLLTGAAGNLREGVAVPLAESYCRRTVESESGSLTVADAEAEGWADDPAYERFELESYVGSVLEVDGDRKGTVCFAGDDPYQESLDTVVEFVDLLAEWVGYEVSIRTGRSSAREDGVIVSFVDSVDRGTVDTALDLLSSQLRRELLTYLAQSDGPVTLTEAVETLAAGAGPDRSRSPEQVEVALVHCHVPRLRHAGVVTYDEHTQELTYRPTDALDRLLEQTRLFERWVSA